MITRMSRHRPPLRAEIGKAPKIGGPPGLRFQALKNFRIVARSGGAWRESKNCGNGIRRSSPNTEKLRSDCFAKRLWTYF